MTRLAYAISLEEGFNIPSSIPLRRNNPGDLRHSPHSSHEGIGKDDVGKIDTLQHGWEDLDHQLSLYAKRGLTLEEMVAIYAPPSDHNDTRGYLNGLCKNLGASPSVLVEKYLTPLVKDIK